MTVYDHMQQLYQDIKADATLVQEKLSSGLEAVIAAGDRLFQPVGGVLFRQDGLIPAYQSPGTLLPPTYADGKNPTSIVYIRKPWQRVGAPIDNQDGHLQQEGSGYTGSTKPVEGTDDVINAGLDALSSGQTGTGLIGTFINSLLRRQYGPDKKEEE